MSIPQAKFREIVFLILYSHDFVSNDKEELVSKVMRELRVTKKAVYQAFSKVESIWEALEQINPQIEASSDEYSYARITRVELNALRLGLFEIQYEKQAVEVSISEAIRLAKKFGSPEGAKFVNAILDQVCKKQSV